MRLSRRVSPIRCERAAATLASGMSRAVGEAWDEHGCLMCVRTRLGSVGVPRRCGVRQRRSCVPGRRDSRYAETNWRTSAFGEPVTAACRRAVGSVPPTDRPVRLEGIAVQLLFAAEVVMEQARVHASPPKRPIAWWCGCNRGAANWLAGRSRGSAHEHLGGSLLALISFRPSGPPPECIVWNGSQYRWPVASGRHTPLRILVT